METSWLLFILFSKPKAPNWEQESKIPDCLGKALGTWACSLILRQGVVTSSSQPHPIKFLCCCSQQGEALKQLYVRTQRQDPCCQAGYSLQSHNVSVYFKKGKEATEVLKLVDDRDQFLLSRYCGQIPKGQMRLWALERTKGQQGGPLWKGEQEGKTLKRSEKL